MDELQKFAAVTRSLGFKRRALAVRFSAARAESLGTLGTPYARGENSTKGLMDRDRAPLRLDSNIQEFFAAC